MSALDQSDSPTGGDPPYVDRTPQGLVDAAISSQVRQNRDRAAQLELYAEMQRRCQADHDTRRPPG